MLRAFMFTVCSVCLACLAFAGEGLVFAGEGLVAASGLHGIECMAGLVGQAGGCLNCSEQTRGCAGTDAPIILLSLASPVASCQNVLSR